MHCPARSGAGTARRKSVPGAAGWARDRGQESKRGARRSISITRRFPGESAAERAPDRVGYQASPGSPDFRPAWRSPVAFPLTAASCCGGRDPGSASLSCKAGRAASITILGTPSTIPSSVIEMISSHTVVPRGAPGTAGGPPRCPALALDSSGSNSSPVPTAGCPPAGPLAARLIRSVPAPPARSGHRPPPAGFRRPFPDRRRSSRSRGRAIRGPAANPSRARPPSADPREARNA